jgi:acetoin utilization deacetylase AcuC-like enzyme
VLTACRTLPEPRLSSACVGSYESEDDDDASEGRPTRPVKRRRTATGPSTRHARYGLVDDSPAFEGLAEYCLAMAGGSLAAAQEVRDGRADVGICWDGGRHHAKRSSCSGQSSRL